MNPSVQPPLPPLNQAPTPTPQIDVAPDQVTSVDRTLGALFRIGQLLFSLVFIVIGGVLVGKLFDQSYTASAPATITYVNKSSTYNSSTSQTETTCTLSYNFAVGGKTYTGTGSVGSESNCGRPIGSTLTVQYNPDDPSHSTVDGKQGGIIGAIFLAVGLGIFVTAIVRLVRLRTRTQR